MAHNVLERDIFLGANTPDGFVGFFDRIADYYDLRKVYILKGGSGVGKSTFIRKFAKELIKHADKNLTVDYLVCSGDPTSCDGAIIHELGVAIIDGTAPHITDPRYPGLVEEIIDLAQFIDPKKLGGKRDQINQIQKRKSEHYKRAFEHLYQAREVHKELEAIYTPSVDFSGVDEVLARVLTKI